MVVMTDEPRLGETNLRLLHETQVSAEKFRVALSNRLSALDRGVDRAANPEPAIYDVLFEKAEELEGIIDDAIAKELENWTVWREWLRHVKGIGPSLAGQMLALLLPPIAEKGPSSWFKAAGLYAEQQPDGLMRLPKARRVRCPNCGGERFHKVDDARECVGCNERLPEGYGKVSYHPWLRRCLYNVGTSFVRNGGYYRLAYEDAKARLLRLHEGDKDWPPIRLDRAARWAMVKLFLSHLWEAWCEADGIPNRGPYIATVKGHTLIPRPMPNGKAKI